MLLGEIARLRDAQVRAALEASLDHSFQLVLRSPSIPQRDRRLCQLQARAHLVDAVCRFFESVGSALQQIACA